MYPPRKKDTNKLKAPIICFLMEIYQREFEVKLYLTLHAVKKGFQVIITEQNSPTARGIKNCIIFNKDHAAWSKVFFRDKNKRNILTCALDEEALIVGDQKTYINSRISKDILENIDSVFAWGNVHAQILKEYSSKPEKVYVTGNPKFDLTRFYRRKSRADEVVSRILVNTRFSYTNSNVGNVQDIILRSEELGYVANNEQLLEFKNMINSDISIQNEFEAFIQLVGNDPNIEVTIRPHPVEDDAIYQEFSSKYDNLSVDRDSDLRQQIVDHDCVIHDGCTTAIESYAIGVPVYGLRPEGLVNPYDDFANQFSLNFTSAKILYAYLSGRKNKDLEFVVTDENIDDHIANFSRNSLSSTENILLVINKLNSIPMKKFKPSSWARLELKQRIYNFFLRHSLLSLIFKGFIPQKFDKFMSGRASSDRKFPDYSAEHIRREIARIQNVDESLTDINIRLERIGRKTYLFTTLP